MTTYRSQDVAALIEKMAAEREALVTTARTLSGAAADRVPRDAEGEEQWTAKEQLAHLWEMERTYVTWCRRALEEDGVDVTGLSSDPAAIPIEDAPSHSIAELVEALRAERTATLAFVRSLMLPDFERTARRDLFGELTVMQWLRSFYRHDRQHHAQIQGRESDYRPRFVDGREPNQRQQRIAQGRAHHA